VAAPDAGAAGAGRARQIQSRHGELVQVDSIKTRVESDHGFSA
jgi:hypothetical protein